MRREAEAESNYSPPAGMIGRVSAKKVLKPRRAWRQAIQAAALPRMKDEERGDYQAGERDIDSIEVVCIGPARRFAVSTGRGGPAERAGMSMQPRRPLRRSRTSAFGLG